MKKKTFLSVFGWMGPGCFLLEPTKKFSPQNGKKTEGRKLDYLMDKNAHVQFLSSSSSFFFFLGMLPLPFLFFFFFLFFPRRCFFFFFHFLISWAVGGHIASFFFYSFLYFFLSFPGRCLLFFFFFGGLWV